MIPYTLNELQWATNATLHGVADATINSIATDSRTISQGRGLLFFAIVGQHHNGHDYITALYKEHGLRRFVISEIRPEFHDLPEASFLLVDNTLTALQQLATYHRQRFEMPIVAITGSNGKTIVKEWLAHILAHSFKVHHSPKSYNSQIGVPLSILGLNPTYEVGVYEAGISQMREMQNLQRIIRPTLGIFTNLGHAHQQGFPDLPTKGREKLSLFDHAKQLITSRDNPLPYQLALEHAKQHGVELITWSTQGAPATYTISLQHTQPDAQPTFTITHDGEQAHGVLPASDGATTENAINALVAAHQLGIPLQQAADALAELQPVSMRLERRESFNGHALINDTYNCDIESLQVGLAFLNQQAPNTKKTLILSDILQSGETPQNLYQQVQQLVNQYGITQLIGIGPDIASQQHLFPNAHFHPTTEDFLQHLNRNELLDSAILVKGSRSFAFERITQQLEKRIHRTTLEVNLNAIVHNLNYFRSLLQPNVKLLVLVKASAYGNGSEELGQLLQFHKVDYLGVAFADEGIALRQAGVNLPILVLNPAPDSYQAIIDHHLEPEIFSRTSLLHFQSTALRNGQTAYPIHLKLDTGMHRVGFTEEDLPQLLDLLAHPNGLRIASIFTHLATSDMPEEDAFTLSQLRSFQSMAAAITARLPYKPLWHALNSAGIERFPNAQFDMVRLGIGLHGISALPNAPTLPVATLRTYVAQVKHLQPGQTVGYGRRGHITRPTTIATIPIGYADGYNRHLGQGVGKVLINGQLLPTIGSICMDTCMIDATGADVHEGDTVTLFGNSPRLADLAQWLDSIPYEVLSAISPRVARLYFAD